MQALAQYAEIVYGGDVDMKIDVSTEGLQHQFAVSSSNNLVLQRLQVSYLNSVFSERVSFWLKTTNF